MFKFVMVGWCKYISQWTHTSQFYSVVWLSTSVHLGSVLGRRLESSLSYAPFHHLTTICPRNDWMRSNDVRLERRRTTWWCVTARHSAARTNDLLLQIIYYVGRSIKMCLILLKTKITAYTTQENIPLSESDILLILWITTILISYFHIADGQKGMDQHCHTRHL